MWEAQNFLKTYEWKFFKSLGLGLLILSLCSCELSKDRGYYDEAQKLAEQKKYEKSIEIYERIVKGFPKSKYAIPAAQEAARICSFNLKNFSKSVEFLKEIIVLSQKTDEIVAAQKNLAEIYFEKLANYQQSIVEYNRLLSYPHERLELLNYRMALARSNYYLGRFQQARTETDEALKNTESDEEKFQALVLKGNILIAEKKMDEANKIFGQILSDYPDLSKKENIGMTLAVGLEEKGDIKGAISVLEKIKGSYPVPDYIVLKIQRLQEKQTQLPGARGVKK